MEHISVLLNESIEGLNINEDGIYVDCTLGGGGHSKKILERLSEKGLLLGIDQDDYALDYARKRLAKYSNIKFVKDNFSNLDNILSSFNIEKVDGILLDLGISSFQFDDKDRGFSYWEETSLDMRMDSGNNLTAKKIVNEYSLEELNNVFREYGEEKNSYKIAKKIISYRVDKVIETNKELIDIIKSVLSEKEKRKSGHPARKVFQALRIEVNNEIGVLKEILEVIDSRLKVGGRLAVITFHSLEDRVVKQFINEKVNPCICPPDFPECTCGLKPSLIKITRKPIIPSDKELEMNSRARSSKLRIAEKI